MFSLNNLDTTAQQTHIHTHAHMHARTPRADKIRVWINHDTLCEPSMSSRISSGTRVIRLSISWLSNEHAVAFETLCHGTDLNRRVAWWWTCRCAWACLCLRIGAARGYRQMPEIEVCYYARSFEFTFHMYSTGVPINHVSRERKLGEQIIGPHCATRGLFTCHATRCVRERERQRG